MLMDFLSHYQINAYYLITLKASNQTMSIDEFITYIEGINKSNAIKERLLTLGMLIDKDMILAYLAGTAELFLQHSNLPVHK
ncbi:hypothetical protein [Bacillus sp. FJAT-44742]|uniref:hypothetical protein n=1 Tax=Bacillus sp. FJAT-44742 TaxID=2014005 RepID=UPI000C23E637|nr:hypothetical protein [Bacillus sp. FJAT-44742]